MARINVLNREVAELIAAGEVVERPASVIKELVENSIDAGADNIAVEIRNGGTTYMRVTDNGCGIAREDVPLAFVSHATSKVISASDLENICTLGFRGEALASICAVSRIEMLTCPEGDEVGTRCTVQGGEMLEIDDAGCPKGTTIVVRDLFFNVPARMKFLKKDVTEANVVYSVVENIAMSHPEISVRLIKDGKISIQTSGDGKIISVIHSLLGKEFASSLIKMEYELGGCKISGYISKPSASRPNRTMQHFFVNGRTVRSPLAMKALEEAYKGTIMVGKYPGCVLNIELDPHLVDVNVHPAKTQVRFVNEKAAFEAVYYAAKNAIKGSDTPKVYQHGDSRRQIREFTDSLYRSSKTVQTGIGEVLDEEIIKPKTAEQKNEFWRSASSKDNFALRDGSKFRYSDDEKSDRTTENPEEKYVPPVIKFDPNDPEKFEEVVTPPENLPGNNTDNKADALSSDEAFTHSDENTAVGGNVSSKREIPKFRVVGEAFKTYIIVELEKELLLFDKHACHERMIYEQLKSNLSAPESQMLIKPVAVTLSREEYAAAVENISSFSALGFGIEDFGEGTLLVRDVPTMLIDENIESAVAEIAGYLSRNKKELQTEKMDWMLHSAACRAAIKAGDTTSEYEMERFVAQLLSRDDIRYCPHGRPVCISMPKREIEKNFGRLG